MIKTKENLQEQKKKKSNLRRVTALGVMFSVGVSAFAGNGSLFDITPEKIDKGAITDVVKIVNYVNETSKDGQITKEEQDKIDALKSDYDKNYGTGACKFVLNTMRDYSKTPGGMSLLQQGETGLIFAAHRAVKEAAQKQDCMRILGSLTGKTSTLADYEGFER